MAEDMSALRDEIVEAQRARYEFLKWKLGLVAGLGSAGLGLGGASKQSGLGQLDFLLCLIPLVCIYVDVLCAHMNLRIMVIARYLRDTEPAAQSMKGYEAFAQKAREMKPADTVSRGQTTAISAFVMEDWALQWSTVLLSAFVLVYGCLTMANTGFWRWLFLIPALPPLLWSLGIPGRRKCTAPVKPAVTVVLSTLLLLLGVYVITTHLVGAALPGQHRAAWAAFFGAGLLGLVLTAIIQCLYAARNSGIASIHLPDDAPAGHWRPVDSGDSALAKLIKQPYTAQDIRDLRAFLEKQGTFSFPALGNGLFPAIGHQTAGKEIAAYRHVWVRDNVFVAHAHRLNGREQRAALTAKTLCAFFKKYLWRFRGVIEARTDAQDPMQRPHVRFDGQRLEELDQKWPHAQNDAIGYFLWLYAGLARDEWLRPAAEDLELLHTIVEYLQAIRFWEDEDSGHWEETRKIGASSIGVVVGALEALKALYAMHRIDAAQVEALIRSGREALSGILPNECIQADPHKRRAHDAALLFLLYPTHVVEGPMAERILADVRTHLQGKHGIRRYRGDSYWCPDYKKHFGLAERTADFSENIEARDALLGDGEEAQWCIFDPIVSVIYGERYKASRGADDFKQQTIYLNRALSQLTDEDSEFGPWKCPEAYYIQAGRYVPNDQTPLLWTQANLWIALKQMEDSLSLGPVP